MFAALAVTRFAEQRTGWSIKNFVRTTRIYRTIQIRTGQHTLTAEDPLPPDLRDALASNDSECARAPEIQAGCVL